MVYPERRCKKRAAYYSTVSNQKPKDSPELEQMIRRFVNDNGERANSGEMSEPAKYNQSNGNEVVAEHLH